MLIKSFGWANGITELRLKAKIRLLQEHDLTLADLQETQDELASVKAEIAAEQEKFDTAVAQLRGRQKELEAELAKGLRAELAAIGGRKPRGKIDEKKIIAALQRRPDSPASYIYKEIDGAALGISPGSLSQKLASMAKRKVLIRDGKKRGTVYRVA